MEKETDLATTSSYESYWGHRKDSGNRYRYSVFLSWLPEGSHVLDVGCGDGFFGERAQRERGCHVTGIDVSETALERARQRGLTARSADLSRPLPFENNSFDYVVASEVIEHVPHSEELLKEAMRISRKGVILSIPNTGFWKYRLQLLSGRFPKQWIVHPWEHLRFWTMEDFKETLHQLGFVCESIRAGSGRRYLRDWLPSLFAEQICYKIAKKT